MTQLLMASAIAAALVSGIFFAFSTFVMRALGRLAPGVGIAAMQSINVVVINPLFFLAFFGTAALCVATSVTSLFAAPGVSPVSTFIGCILYVVGCVGVTMFGNVPLNNTLAATDPDDSASESLWSSYVVRWTRWNHVRTIASLAAAVCFAFAHTAG